MSWLHALLRHLPPGWQPASTVLKHRAIPDALWLDTLHHYPFLMWRPARQQERLRQLSTLFLARTRFSPAGGLALDDAMAVAIAAQACLPVLARGLHAYGRIANVVVHPGAVRARREVMDEAGVVHVFEEELSGEAMADGPIMLSWHDVEQARDLRGYNVVVHEFVHLLDMMGGPLDGTPPLPAHISHAQWQGVMWRAFDQHSEALAHGDATWLDPYAVHDGLVEFFPVVAEAFYVAPLSLRADYPQAYALLASYFEDDPACFA